MKYTTLFMLLLMLCVTARQSVAQAIPEPPPPSDNAAVWYLTAQQFMGNYDEDAKAVIDKWQDVDLEAAATVINNKLFNEMAYIRRGAAQQHCSWAVDIRKDGAKALLPHLTMLREYGKILAVSGQVRLEQGDAEGAIEDFVAIMHLSRHAADDGTLIGCLLQMSLDKVAAQALAKQLHRFDRAQLKSLSEQLASVPEPKTIQSSIASERLMSQWIGTAAKQAVKDGDYEGLVGLGLMGFGQEPKTEKQREQLLMNINKQLDELDAFYQQLYENLALPNHAFIKADKQFIDDVTKSKNRLIAVLMPALGSAYQTERRSHSLRAILDAAIALRLGGERAFRAVTDPADGGPFTRMSKDTSLVLASRLKKKGQAVSLVFSPELEVPLD